MVDILSITGPIFLTIGVGFLAVRQGLVAKADLRVLGGFVVNFALPALLFNALAQRRFTEVMNPTYVGAYAFGSLAAAGLGWLWARRVEGREVTASAFVAMGMAASNSGFVGYPIMLLTLPAVAGVALALNMLVENLLMLPLLLAVAEHGRNPSSSWGAALAGTFRRLVVNPLVIGLVCGLAFSLTGWTLPTVFSRTVTLFAQASAALSLFVIGGTLVGLHLRGLAAQVAPILVGKLVAYPLFVAAAAGLLLAAGAPALSRDLHAAVILTAAMPIMGIYTLLAQRHGQEDRAAAALLGTTVFSFFTLNALLWALGRLPPPG